MKFASGLVGLAVGLSLLPSVASANTCGGVDNFDPVPQTNSFAAGSMVVPMDTCYNPDDGSNTAPTNTAGACVAGPGYTCYNQYSSSSNPGNIRLPFGILYLLAENNIPVNIILNQSKNGLNDDDFSVTPSYSGGPDTATYIAQSSGTYSAPTPAASTGLSVGTNTIHYGGMPFVIDASYVPQALAVLQTFNAAQSGSDKDLFAAVPLHIINYPFTAPVLGSIQSRPKPALIDEPPLDGFFTESGIPLTTKGNCTANPSTNGSCTTYILMKNAFSFDWPSGITANGVCTTGCTTLSDSSGNNFIDVVWSTNQTGGTDIGNFATWSAIPTYLQNGGTVLAIGSGISWETTGTGGQFGGTLEETSHGDEAGPFCAAVAVKHALGDLSNPGPATYYPASNRFLQVSDINLNVKGSSSGIDKASTMDFLSSNPTALGVAGLSNAGTGTGGYMAIAGHPMVSGSQVSGNLIYLGSLESWNGGSHKDAGLHIMYNTLIAGSGCGTSKFTPTELTRSTSVASYSSTSAKVAEYLGTFDWYIPTNASAMGNALYTPDKTSYPYETGHFREYKQAGTFNSTGVDYVHCSPAPTSACNWDAATTLSSFDKRNIFYMSGTTMTQYPTTATSGDATLDYVMPKLNKTSGVSTIGVMGGVDYGTAAVIEGLPTGLVTVASAPSRPTLAYVGARDGMLHAFCVAGPSGTSTCYGKNPGEEVWAFILPGMKTQLDKAYASGVAANMDWSNVNVGGIIRVADVLDDFEGHTAVYRTVLLVGMHDTGYLDAIDISDPNPANFGKDGFNFLWEQDGTTKYDGTTQEPMGKTWGATFSLTATGGSVISATASTCYGMGFPTTSCGATVTSGENYYLIRMSDGQVINTVQKLYSRTSLLFGATIPNDVPAPPTTLDGDSDGFDETVLVPALDGKVRRYTLMAGTPVTVDTTKNLTIFDASSACAAGVACEPIGSPVTIVRNTGGSTYGGLVVTGGADWAREPSPGPTTYHVYAFNPLAASTTTAYGSSTLPTIKPPLSTAPGSGSTGISAVPLYTRGFAQMTVSGTDLYADLTTLSLGDMQQVVQPLITPGTYGTVLRYSKINTGSTIGGFAYAVAQGASFAGGAGATFTFQNSSGSQSLFAADVTGANSLTMETAPSSSSPSSGYAVNQTAGSGVRNWTVQTWIDSSN